MSYQVLARKWRPHRFEDMVGQRHVLQALTNALDSDRLHHAYLFTGTRGVGKTTVARIFAKSLNCEQGISASPCGQCSSCVEIDEGRFVDLIEVDAASRTGVDDTRDLLENVQYSPTRGRYKVYLIDEVHMFSKSSFNALLKTLEEPPPHIKFLLATTDPKRIPPTILSRCLQFNLKRLTPEQIEQQLVHILEQESINADTRSLEMIAFAADGSLRDALSLLDQAISYGDSVLKANEVASMLGTIDKDQVLDLLHWLAKKDPAEVLEKIAQLDELGPDYQVILSELLAQLQAVAVKQLVPTARADQRDNQRLAEIAALLTAEECQLYYQIALNGQRDLSFHPDPRGGFEMTLLRMLAFQITEQGANINDQAPSTTEKKKPVAPADEHSKSPVEHHRAPADEPATVQVKTNIAATPDDWPFIIEELQLDGLVHQLAICCALEQYENNEFRLTMTPGTMCTDRMKQQLEQVLRKKYGSELRLLITEKMIDGLETPRAKQSREEQQRLEEARQVIESDPDIQRLCEAFDATIIEESIMPVKKS